MPLICRELLLLKLVTVLDNLGIDFRLKVDFMHLLLFHSDIYWKNVFAGSKLSAEPSERKQPKPQQKQEPSKWCKKTLKFDAILSIGRIVYAYMGKFFNF